MPAIYRAGRRCLPTGMFARDLANWPFRQELGVRPTGAVDTVTGGATMAASSGARFPQSPRSTPIADEATVSVSAISASAPDEVYVTSSNDGDASEGRFPPDFPGAGT